MKQSSQLQAIHAMNKTETFQHGVHNIICCRQAVPVCSFSSVWTFSTASMSCFKKRQQHFLHFSPFVRKNRQSQQNHLLYIKDVLMQLSKQNNNSSSFLVKEGVLSAVYFISVWQAKYTRGYLLG